MNDITRESDEKKIKVLIVDDSAVMRNFLKEQLEAFPQLDIVGTAMDAYIAAEKIKRLKPDVITLDVEMPKMDGLSFLKKIMKYNPLPVVMVSAYTARGKTETMRAMSLGAVDCVLKPEPSLLEKEKDVFARELLSRLVAASQVTFQKSSAEYDGIQDMVDDIFSGTTVAKKTPPENRLLSDRVIALGTSTGGVPVIEEILMKVKPSLPAILVVIHMPQGFTELFAERLNNLSRLYVKQASQGDLLYCGSVYVAPGDKHLVLTRKEKGFAVSLDEREKVNGFRPSVDVLFGSVAEAAGKKGTGVILTGMGGDGAEGLKMLRNKGGQTMAQDQASCAVFGMPRVAIKIGAAMHTGNINEIVELLNSIC